MPSESVKVIVRCRPMNERERNKQCSTIVQADEKNMQLTLTNPSETDVQKVFPYDAVFGINSLQQTVYEEAGFPLVESVMEGYNGTIFAYGQTGCGKTHTMMGVATDETLKGIIPRAFDHIFGSIESSTTKEKNYLVRCSYIEIYNEEIHDLIGEDVRAKLDLKENPDKLIYIKGLSMHVVKTVPEIHRLMSLGSKNRSVGETAMNKDSSRSHSIFTIYVESSETDTAGNVRITLGKLNLVDLAGSERQSKTGATGDRLKEANKINLSLSALGNVISALVDGKSSHIPYRDSKLTRLLQDSLGGNTKTVMVANVSPASDNYDETLGTLRYASRAKNIKNQPKVNEDPKDALLREYADEIKRLKEMLETGGGGAQRSEPTHAKRSIGEIDDGGKMKRNDSHYENQLKQKNDEINDERKKREDLESKLKEMQHQLIGGGEHRSNVAEKKKYEEMAKKLKEHHQTHEELLREKNQKEEEALLAEKKYANLQEEVEEQRKIIKRLRKKYKEAANEIKDLARENELNKEDLLDTIRLLERDVKINNAIMAYLLSPEELEKIRSKARWHDDKNEFVVPPFVVRARKVKFPKISQQQGMNMVQDEWDNRDLEFVNYKNDAVEERDEYASDRDWEEQASYGSKGYEGTPQKFGGKDHGRYGSSQSPGSTMGGGYEMKNTVQKNYSNKGVFENANSFRDTMRNAQNHNTPSLPPQKKSQTKNVMLDPIKETQLSNNALNVKVGETNFKSGFNPANIGPLNPNNLPPMKGKAQLQPLNHQGGSNQTAMKLSFKATLLINNDGTNAELHNMSSHVKGYCAL